MEKRYGYMIIPLFMVLTLSAQDPILDAIDQSQPQVVKKLLEGVTLSSEQQALLTERAVEANEKAEYMFKQKGLLPREYRELAMAIAALGIFKLSCLCLTVSTMECLEVKRFSNLALWLPITGLIGYDTWQRFKNFHTKKYRNDLLVNAYAVENIIASNKE